MHDTKYTETVYYELIITDLTFEETNGKEGIYIKMPKVSTIPDITDKFSLKNYFENYEVINVETDFNNRSVKIVISKLC